MPINLEEIKNKYIKSLQAIQLTEQEISAHRLHLNILQENKDQLPSVKIELLNKSKTDLISLRDALHEEYDSARDNKDLWLEREHKYNLCHNNSDKKALYNREGGRDGWMEARDIVKKRGFGLKETKTEYHFKGSVKNEAVNEFVVAKARYEELRDTVNYYDQITELNTNIGSTEAAVAEFEDELIKLQDEYTKLKNTLEVLGEDEFIASVEAGGAAVSDAAAAEAKAIDDAVVQAPAKLLPSAPEMDQPAGGAAASDVNTDFVEVQAAGQVGHIDA